MHVSLPDNAASDQGYSSLAVAGLMAALSLLAIGYSNLSTSKARVLSAKTDILEKDIAIEGFLHFITARLIARQISVDNAWQIRSYENTSLQFRVSFENTKIDINRASPEAIASKLSKSFDEATSGRLVNQVTNSRNPANTTYRFAQDLHQFTNENIKFACLRDIFTVYRSPATQGIRTTRTRPFAEDGTIIRIEIRSIDDTAPRGIDSVVLLTGKQDDPVWTLDWARTSNTTEEACHVET